MDEMSLSSQIIQHLEKCEELVSDEKKQFSGLLLRF